MPPTVSSTKLLATHGTSTTDARIGVGLRHGHYQDALLGASDIDFVEVHAENFFAPGGQARQLLKSVSQSYPVSLHATSMGLGSAAGINPVYLSRLQQLADYIQPWLISDHASFSWVKNHQSNASSALIHSGDLLPLEFNEQGLSVLTDNVDQVQQLLGRPILIENISSYISTDFNSISEPEFLVALVERSQCRLLVDLNNLLVNAHNRGCADPLADAKQWLNAIPLEMVGEFHLAGYSKPKAGSPLIDDHAAEVSGECWNLYRLAIERFGPTPTIIEWDNDLPTWEKLVEQAAMAREIAQAVAPRYLGERYA